MSRIKVKLVKYLMNFIPNKPVYQEEIFMSEIFRHPNYTSLSKEDKCKLKIQLVKNNMLEERDKPFDLFYPSLDLKSELSHKKVLDLGCGIGGKTIFNGEKWGISEFYGIDVNSDSISTANEYLKTINSNVKYKFVEGYAEKMPFEDESFDAIISHDTVEHVRSVEDTMYECKRILKKGGKAYLVFPSINLPFGGAHIGSVTKMPFLEWFFSPEIINEAYLDIIKGWDDDLNWFKPTEETQKDWSVIEGGIGVNGMKYNSFIQILDKVGFSDIKFIKIPLLYVSNTANKYPLLKLSSKMLNPIISIDYFKDYLTHRLTFILTK